MDDRGNESYGTSYSKPHGKRQLAGTDESAMPKQILRKM
jgi:hypothetical protein